MTYRVSCILLVKMKRELDTVDDPEAFQNAEDGVSAGEADLVEDQKAIFKQLILDSFV